MLGGLFAETRGGTSARVVAMPIDNDVSHRLCAESYRDEETYEL